jgi:oxygen-independent coproporphyrinogen III oxidase
MAPALVRELELRQSYLEGATVETIYFGGGTPSILPVAEIAAIIRKIQALFPMGQAPEITLEANPDDMTLEWLTELRSETPVNRLSIGVQSFHDADLAWMNRAHDAGHARQCIERALAFNFDNFTIDLIFGTPTTTDAMWAENLAIAFDYGIPHLSCYGLTVEEGTALGHQISKGKIPALSDEQSARQFGYLMDACAAQGYMQYEISNFAKQGKYAQHNSNYWLGQPYLGIGPSAHSFNGGTRQWNKAHNAQYLEAIEHGKVPAEMETLTRIDLYNEYIMTMLRTEWGIHLDKLRLLLPQALQGFAETTQAYIRSGDLTTSDDKYVLTRKGRFVADKIASDLFFVEEAE